MDYGNRLAHVRGAALVGSALGLAAVLFAVAMISVQGGWAKARPLGLLLVYGAPALGLPLVVGLTCCFCIRVRGGVVQHLLFKRFVLSQRPVADFVGLEIGAFPNLRFRGGR